MDPLFRWIEATSLSGWIGQSASVFAFPAILVVHTLGMAMLAGVSAVMDLRLLGFAPQIPTDRLARFWPLFSTGLVLNIASGLLLLVGYPTKALTNPVFYVKLACVGTGVWTALRIRGALDAAPQSCHRGLAYLSLTAWTFAIVFGRLLEYTYSRLYVDFAGS